MDYISSDARAAFQQIIHRSIRATLGRNPGDEIQVQTLAVASQQRPTEKAVTVLTVSSFRFRMLIMFPLSEDPAVHEYFTLGAGDVGFEEVFAEIANLCCGAINRDLSGVFPHLGMSTPATLSNDCLEYLNALNPEFPLHLSVSIAARFQLKVIVSLCAYAPIDFKAPPAAVQAEVGALEVF